MEDEWERQIDSDKDLDLLFITYRPAEITLERLMQVTNEHGFDAEVKEDL